MTIWAKSEVAWYYGDGMDTGKCTVRIDGDEIALEYIYDGRRFVLTGRQEGEGHFRLSAAHDPRCRSDLHRFAEDDMLVGTWFDSGYVGMCKIQLISDDDLL